MIWLMCYITLTIGQCSEQFTFVDGGYAPVGKTVLYSYVAADGTLTKLAELGSRDECLGAMLARVPPTATEPARFLCSVEGGK